VPTVKRAIAVVALALPLAVLPGLAGAGQDLSLQDPPGAPHIGTALCLPAAPGAQLSCPAPDLVGTVASEVQSVPAVAPAAVPEPVVPAVVADPAYAARLHADLCAARPVFCEVDDSGKYLTR
jgi:hypothetical protein